ncbi:hypothetical protein N7461_001780 [Penicillium sp. DV-2018c]|nr:hypothetical protein N7461_001780 [Penicillium sp. DV-2018c]
MSEIRVVLRRRSVAKRWLRSWVFTPLGNVKIKLINKIERKRYRSIPDAELKKMVLDALTDHYPNRRFRNDSRAGTLSSGRTSIINDVYNLSVLELGLMSPGRKDRLPERSFRWGKGICPRTKQVKAVTLAVATVQPQDGRSSWGRGVNEPVLRVLNPDWPSSGSEGSVENPSLILASKTESSPVELPVIALTTPDAQQPHLSNEDALFAQPETILSSGVDRSSRPVVAAVDAVPRLPDLYFVSRPTMPLCCSITQTLRYSNSAMLFEQGVCSCSTSLPADISSDLCDLLSTFTINNRELPDSPTKDSPSRRHRTRDASWPQPLKISKSQDCLRDKIQNGPLPPLPARPHHQHHERDAASPTAQPYNLRYKVQHGSLPPLPRHDSHFTELSQLLSGAPSSPEPDTVPEPDTSSDLPSRELALSGPASSARFSWASSQTEINVQQSTHASLGSSNRQTTSLSFPHQPPPGDRTQHRHTIEDLPPSLRVGPQSGQWQQDTVSQLPDDSASGPLVDRPPTSAVGPLWSAGSLEAMLAVPVFDYYISIQPLLDVALCFGAGAVAKARRRREE